MKKTILLLATAFVIVASPFVRAEGSLSDAQLDAIRTNCTSAQISLQHAQASDKLTRLNRGPKYETLLKLMTNFNSRVAENKLDAPELITIASNYQKTWDSFRTAYTEYDDAMTAIVQMNCKSEPTTFNDQLVALRNKRTSLNRQVKEFDALLDKYQKGVDAIKLTQQEQAK